MPIISLFFGLVFAVIIPGCKVYLLILIFYENIFSIALCTAEENMRQHIAIAKCVISYRMVNPRSVAKKIDKTSLIFEARRN